ncbi:MULTISPECIES: DUF2784 domain-containing protein [Olivibacter]|uniref:DUF2784 domain-containing protein n=1 Tax=Olivibacter oleidegradans TaxID=760123 RepID=A0ABV6HIW9_9SPHI|nr:DUF2784 domain-containing protein [Olivibacter jilunii]
MEKYIYLFLTQLTVIIHLLFIFFVVIGGFFLNKSLWVRILHPVSVIWGVYAELSSGVLCPLTALENYFGYHAGLSTYEEDFITRHLVPIIYQEDLTRNIQFVLVVIVISVNAIAYSLYWKRRKLR